MLILKDVLTGIYMGVLLLVGIWGLYGLGVKAAPEGINTVLAIGLGLLWSIIVGAISWMMFMWRRKL